MSLGQGMKMGRALRGLACVLLAGFCSAGAFAGQGGDSTLAGKLLVGYQGWFRCPGDGSPRNSWSHWSRGVPSAATTSIDVYPDTTGLKPQSLCPVPGMTIGGKQAYLFSSYPKETVQTHFEWMRTYEIDGALLQRFINEIRPLHQEGDVILRNVQSSAESTGRSFAIEYDLSGAHPDTALKQLQDDWTYLTQDLKITSSPAYLTDGGEPVVALWGLGFNDRSHIQDPAVAMKIVEWFKNTAHVKVMGGVPASWRTFNGDGTTNRDWDAVYAALDIVQPWTVGRYGSPAAADQWKNTHVSPDVALTKKRKQEYMPVIFPGFSWHNLNRDKPENQIPRLGGEFLWRQAYNAKKAGASCIKIAMFDEVNEGTAILKAAPTRHEAPDQGYWLTLDADGGQFPSDWYLRLAEDISRMFRGTLAAKPELPESPSARVAKK